MLLSKAALEFLNSIKLYTNSKRKTTARRSLGRSFVVIRRVVADCTNFASPPVLIFEFFTHATTAARCYFQSARLIFEQESHIQVLFSHLLEKIRLSRSSQRKS